MKPFLPFPPAILLRYLTFSFTPVLITLSLLFLLQPSVRAQTVTATVVTSNPNDKFTYDGQDMPHYGVKWTLDSWRSGGWTGWFSAYSGFKFFTLGSPKVIITDQGNVGIGLIDPTEKLSVNGNIKAKKITVTLTGWPDYVFEPTYQLPSLLQVEQYIRLYKHLPGIPSAPEVTAKGLDVGENQALLLKKIEELKLYLIDLKKENEQLKERLHKIETIKH